MNDNWLVKYESKNLDDYSNNQDIIAKIENTLNNDKSIIIKGNCGIGKNNILKIIANKFNYDLYNYKLNDKKEINLNLFYNKLFNLKKSKILILNKIDYITTNLEKKNIQQLNKLHLSKQTTNFKIIYLIEKNITKTVKELNKNINLFELNDPSYDMLEKIIDNISEKEDIKIEKEVIKYIIELSQYDIRKLILILKDLKYTFDNIIDINNFKKYCEFTNEKIKSFNIIETTKKVLNNYNNVDNFNFYNNEKVILPLMLYENYLDKFKYSFRKENMIDYIIKISNFISKGDIIETNIYTDQNWYLQNIHGFYTVIYTSYLINDFDNNQYDINVKYSSDLNKTSLKNINKKNFSQIKDIFYDKLTSEILYVSLIFTYLLSIKDFKNLKMYIKNYDLNYKLFEIFLKINKLINFKISTTQTKEVNAIINS